MAKLEMYVMCRCGAQTPVNLDETPQVDGRYVCINCAPAGTPKSAYAHKVLT